MRHMPRPLSQLSSARFAVAAAILSVINFLAVFDGLVVTVALPQIQNDLRLSQLHGQWVLTSFTLPLGGLLLLGGRCGDRFGRRRVMMLGLYLFIIGLIGAGLAQSAAVMFPARALQGTGAAFAIPNTYAMISSMRSKQRRNKVFAAVAVAGSSGAVAGAVIGGAITEMLGWRYVFLLSVPIAIAAAVITPKVIAPQSADQSLPIDWWAAALSTTALMALIYCITSVAQYGFTSWPMIISLTGGLFLLATLVFRERSARWPLVPPPLLRVRPLRAAMAGMPGQVFAYQGTVYIGLLFFQDSLGYSPLRAGAAFAPLGIAAFVASPLVTRLLANREWALVAFAAQTVCAVGLAILATAQRGAYLGRVMPGLIFLGLGIAVAAVTFNLAAGEKVTGRDKGVAYGLFETSTHVSGALVVAVLATITVAVSEAASIDGQAALASGYRAAFATASAAAFVAGVLTLILGRSHHKPTPVGDSGVATPVRETPSR
jgi:MFS family permease